MKGHTDNYLLTHARVDPSGCSNLTVHCQSWCQKHLEQKDALHKFYHTTDDRWECLKRSSGLRDTQDTVTKQAAITLLAVTLVARQAMTDWFYKGEPEDGHADHEWELSSHLKTTRNSLFGMKYGIIILIPELELREIIRKALIQIPSAEQKYQPECNPDRDLDREYLGQDQYQYHTADRQSCGSEQGCSDQYEGGTNPWSSLDDLQYIELLDMDQVSAHELSSIDCLYIADVHATDHTKVEW
ncbi:hypothetical protein PG991_002987 [Apiospora marii]|uniref:Uncharacterized protein n=1 Tax=Apiospora marii TaxID=335849 RepID=A0ABR1SIN1_9PEZI